MYDRWETQANAARVLQHEGDSRPAWLWSQDGQRLIWQNAAAGLFLARLKKHGLKRAAPAVPIKGQVARILRLGAAGRSSLARIQFLSGEKPISATCATTPLRWDDGDMALLVVGVDPIDDDVLAAAGAEDAVEPETTPAAEPDETAPEKVEPFSSKAQGDGESAADPTVASPSADYARELESWQAADAETVYDPADAAVELGYIPEADADNAESWHAALGEDQPASPSFSVVSEPSTEPLSEEAKQPDVVQGVGRLSGLFDRLASDDALFTPLTEEDDAFSGLAADEDAALADNSEFAPDDEEGEWGDAPLLATEDVEGPLYKVTGRGFTPLHREQPDEPATVEPIESDADTAVGEGTDNAVQPSTDPTDRINQLREAMASIQAEDERDNDAVERTSRYNFDELTRILTDRVGDRGSVPAPPDAGTLPSASAATPAGALINLGGETLVLNRLPLGILVFRDQQVLFANRAITEMVGYDSVESLRSAGLSAIFPAAGPGEQGAGPVNHLVQRDGTLVPVTARLQSMSWQGKPALMLSASTTEVRTGHEDAVRAFAQTFADILGDGYIEANRNGVVSNGNGAASAALAAGRPLVGQPLSGLIGEDDAVALSAFLERPARFAESSRPCATLRARDGKADILLFALGQAGIVSGYFGFVRHRQMAPARLAAAAEIDPALLSRISRGVRRPLNTIVGFSDLLRSKAFGDIGNERAQGYADDIATAGQEIAALVDELDDYARLRDGRYLPQRASLDLTELLESCVIRIKGQANRARVIVRNAISETLPRITADRASLAQAVLNLLASAIDQTPVGGAVVISAQHHDDGAIAIHVRDSSAHAVDMAERFVVFRDGMGRDGQVLAPVRSSVGLALTRSLLAVNTVSLSVDPAGVDGMLFTLKIPGDLIDRRVVTADADK